MKRALATLNNSSSLTSLYSLIEAIDNKAFSAAIFDSEEFTFLLEAAFLLGPSNGGIDLNYFTSLTLRWGAAQDEKIWRAAKDEKMKSEGIDFNFISSSEDISLLANYIAPTLKKDNLGFFELFDKFLTSLVKECRKPESLFYFRYRNKFEDLDILKIIKSNGATLFVENKNTTVVPSLDLCVLAQTAYTQALDELYGKNLKSESKLITLLPSAYVLNARKVHELHLKNAYPMGLSTKHYPQLSADGYKSGHIGFAMHDVAFHLMGQQSFSSRSEFAAVREVGYHHLLHLTGSLNPEDTKKPIRNLNRK